MEKFILDDLALEQPSEFNKKLTEHVNSLVSLSRSKMQEKYESWDHFDAVYRGVRDIRDTQDKKQVEKKAPEKQVIPLGYSQVQTFVAFCFSLYFQREFFFELLGNSPEAENSARLAEGLLQRDLDKNKFPAVMYQFLVDTARFGVGVMKCSWEEERKQVTVKQPPKKMSMFGFEFAYGGGTESQEEQVTFQGNKLLNVSPYHFFPDTRLPLGRFQEGEFVAHDNEFSWAELSNLSAAGNVAGTEFVQSFTSALLDSSGHRRSRFISTQVTDQVSSFLVKDKQSPMLVTEMQVKLIPSKWMVGDQPLGPETTPVVFLVWVANCQRVIRCERLNYSHGNFTYYLGEFNPDLHHLLNSGILETVDSMQEVVSWLVNSHITSVRRIIQNQLVVDPEGINMEDIKNHRPVIRTTPGASRTGIDRWIKQLQVSDVTAGHLNDAAVIQDLLQTTTGINDNMMGQYNVGRRSATESRAVTNSATSRLKTVATVLYYTALEPLGRDMLANLRQGMSVETFVRVFGTAADPAVYQQLKPVKPEDLQGSFDFRLFDATLPSEKGYVAETLKEVLVAVLGQPDALMMLQMSPQKLLLEILQLKGVRFPQRFQMSPPEQQLLTQTMMMQNGLAQPQVAGGPPVGGPPAGPMA